MNSELFEAALGAFKNAHAPYSGFRVGAAVRGNSGRVFAGANAENVSYPEGTCAEAGALAALVAAGDRHITEALVVAEGKRLCTPCGGCRQRLAEFGEMTVPIHLCSPSGLRRTLTIGELLPFAFDLESTGEPARAPTAVEVIQARIPGFVPKLGLILGSGLASLAAAIEVQASIPYDDLPGFPKPAVEGHPGRLMLGTLEGMPLACLQGRVHLYEGHSPAAVALLPRTLRALGAETVVLTNASGSLRPELGPGSIVLIEDHINLMGTNPLIGPNDSATGPRFPDLSAVYDLELRGMASEAAAREGLELPGGVYLAVIGPAFETPAEIRAFRIFGADLVGMSTVPEAIAARHCGLRVLGFSIVTNLAAGLKGGDLSHDETLAQSRATSVSLERLLRGLLRLMLER